MEYIDFIGVFTCVNTMAGLVYDARLTEFYEFLRFGNGDFLLPFVAACSAFAAWPFDGQEPFISFDTYAYGTPRGCVEVPLGDMDRFLYKRMKSLSTRNFLSISNVFL